MRKIMFNDRYGLADAVLDGRKTMTRRIATKVLVENENCELCWNGKFQPSRYCVGEEIAIAQKYSKCVNDILTNWGHKTDIATLAFKRLAGWDNKMFVRAELMPHRIRITDIRVERLQDISDEDCLREGIYRWKDAKDCPKCVLNNPLLEFFGFDGRWDAFSTPREAFAALIDKVSGKGTWESNPYVWVYSFELIK